MTLKQTTLHLTRKTPLENTTSAQNKHAVTVVNGKVAELRKLGYQSLDDFLAASSDHLYVGRDMSRYVRGAIGSKWQNKFKANEHDNDLDKVLSLYEESIRNGPLFSHLDELRGKTLACWCYPAPCHATVLKNLVESQSNPSFI